MKYSVTVKPNSHVEEVVSSGSDLLVRTKAPAREGKANVGIIRLIAGYFHVPQGAVRIVSGTRGRKKIIEVQQR